MARFVKATPLVLTMVLLVSIFAGASRPAVTARADSGDRDALVALHNATGGANWTNNENWLSDEPIGEWRGVTTDGDGRVTNLNLGVSGLTGPIPSELGNLTNLEVLYLHSNRLTGRIPTELGGLSNLTDLYLDSNGLTGPIPAELGNLTNLEDLYLHFNDLTGRIPAELGGLSNLSYLDLGGNELTGGIPAELGGLSNLQLLNLSGNRLTGCIPEVLPNVRNNDLDELGLNSCAGAGEAPTISALTAGVASLTVSWTAPANNGGPTTTAYDLRHIETGASDKADANWTQVAAVWTTGSGPLQHVLTGLAGATQYDVQVRAVNAAGESEWSATVTGTTAPPAVPGAPTGLTSELSEDEPRVDLSWTAPISDGGAPITGYKIESSDGGGYLWVEVYTTTDDGVGYTDHGTDGNGPMFRAGVLRHYRVSAVNPVGTGPPSSPTTVGSPPSIEVSYASGSATALVRLKSPISLMATFSEPVSGFALGDISIGNGTAGNLAGSGAVYTFEVTPDAIGEVTVDIAAGVAADAEGDGNTAALQFSLGIPYDDDRDGAISKSEVIVAIRDYFSGGITKAQTIALIRLYFAAPPPAPSPTPVPAPATGGLDKTVTRRDLEYGHAVELPDSWRQEGTGRYASASPWGRLEISSQHLASGYTLDQFAQLVLDDLRQDWWPKASLFEITSVENVLTGDQPAKRIRYRVQEAPRNCALDVDELVTVSRVLPGIPQGFRAKAYMCEQDVAAHGPARGSILDSFRIATRPAAYYRQFMSAHGVTVKADATVDPAAVEAGAEMVAALLSGREDIARCMVRKRAELAIIPKDRPLTSLPEYAYQKGTVDFTGRSLDTFDIRGAGAAPGMPVSSAGEEQVLGSFGPEHPYYPYRGLVVVHEVAHGIQNLCFMAEDHEEWDGFYAEAVRADVYPGTHMMADVMEFFAVFSTGYFEVTDELGQVSGRETLESRFPQVFLALDEIYGGATLPEQYRTRLERRW